MNKNVNLFLGVIILAISFYGCKKAEKQLPLTSDEALITSKDWVMIAGEIASQGGKIDFYRILPDCQKDDLTRYNADNTTTYKSGAVKCNPDEPEVSPGGTWYLDKEKKIFITYDSGDTTRMDILDLTATTFIVSETNSTGGNSVTTVITYSSK
ncbi:MAG: lipocalin family protein [Bacteroidota bacterium]|nr:lipocalin family protein [Bacteroidota bacterium]